MRNLGPFARRTAILQLIALGTLSAVLLSACGSSTTSAPSLDTKSFDTKSWSSVESGAKDQTVNWYMYGGDEELNKFVNGYVTDELKRDGVTLNQVKINDTSEAINKVIGEKQAGKNSDGSVDAIWTNGANFATGVQSRLWYCGWDRNLPNARFVNFDSPSITNDFGVPVAGCESAWQQANSALVYNSAKLTPKDVASMSSLLAWVKASPGHFTYPALPDFTGSMAVRSVLYDTMGGPAALSGAFDETKYNAQAAPLWKRLNDIAPSLWRGGTTYPTSETATEKLYADGEISAYMTYGPGAVGNSVSKGQFPSSTREAVPAGGNIANVSFLSIPYNASHKAAALLLANVLQDPKTQLALYKAEGAYPAIDLSKTDDATRKNFAAVPNSPSVLSLADLTRNAQPELASAYISRIEKDWKTRVLQK